MSSICGIERDELGAAHFLVPVKVSCPKKAQMMILNPIHLLALCPTFSGVAQKVLDSTWRSRTAATPKSTRKHKFIFGILNPRNPRAQQMQNDISDYDYLN
jgi:hypothetical protein